MKLFGLTEFTAEAIVLNPPEYFDDASLRQNAKKRLAEAGIDVDGLFAKPDEQ